MIDPEVLKEYGIDADEGLAYCADDPEFYEEMLGEYVDEGLSGIEELKRYYALSDWKNYGIKAHSIKSASRMIGAKEMSEKARVMETAAKEGNADAVISGQDDFLKKYEALILGLRRILC